jgi:hypothetical protein
MTISPEDVERSDGRRVSRADLLACTLLALGTVIRLREWLAGRSLWHDEATLSMNLLGRDLAGLLRPLDFQQMAPPGYLWAVKGIISFTGPGELSLRAVAMVAGIGLTLTGWWLTRRLFGPWPAAAAAAMLALSPGAIYYSNEVKPYSTDALVAAVLLLAGTWFMNVDRTWRRHAFLALLGAMAVWVSYPAPFTLVGLGAALTTAPMRRKDWPAVWRLAAVGVVWAGSWGLVYHLARQGATVDFMHEAWRDRFLDLSPARPYRAVTSLVLALDVPAQTFRSPLDPWNGAERVTGLMLALLALGIWSLASRRMVAALGLLLSAPLIVLVAAAAHVYPLEFRLILFMLPSLAVLAAGGIGFLSSRGLPQVATLLIVITLFWSCLADLQTLRSPSEREDAVGMLRLLASEARPGDIVYVWPGPGSAVDFYRRTRPSLWRSDVQAIWPPYQHTTPESRLEEIVSLCGRPRVWLAAAHVFPGEQYPSVLAALHARGAIVTSRTLEGAQLTLLDLRNMTCAQIPAGHDASHVQHGT